MAVADTTGKPTGLFHKFPFHKRATICRTRNSKKVFTVKDNSKLNTPSHQKIDNKHLSPRLALIKITRDIVKRSTTKGRWPACNRRFYASGAGRQAISSFAKPIISLARPFQNKDQFKERNSISKQSLVTGPTEL